MSNKEMSRSIFVKILVFLCLLGLSVAVIRPVQSALLHGMANLRTDFIEKIEAYTGLEVQYSSIRPTIFGSFDIRNLKIKKDNNVILSIQRARIYFSLSDLLQGRKTAIRTIQIDRPLINLDLQKDRQLFETLSSLQNKQDDKELLQQITEFLPEHPNYRILDFNIALVDGDTKYQIQDMDLNITGDGTDVFLEGKLFAEYIYTGIVNRMYCVRSDVNINGVYSAEQGESRGEIAFLGISGTEEAKKNTEGVSKIFNMRPLSSAFLLKDNLITIKPLEKEKGIDYQINIENESGKLNAILNCDGFIPTELVSFTGYWEDAKHLLSMSLTGGASFEKDNSALHYNFDFQGGKLLEFNNSFTLRANGNEKKIVVDEFNFSSSANESDKSSFQGRLFFSGETQFDPLMPAGIVVFDRFSLTGDEFFNANFTVKTNPSQSNFPEILITTQTISTNHYSLDDVDIRLFPSDRDLSVTTVGFCGEQGIFSIDAIMNYNPRQIESSLRLDSFSLLSMLEFFRPFYSGVALPSFAGVFIKDMLIDTEIFFTTDFNQIVYNAPRVSLKTDDNSGIFSFSGTDKQFTLNEGVFTINEKDFMASAQVNFFNPNDLNFIINANYLDFSWHVQGQILDKTTLIMSDPNGLHVYGSASNSGALSGYIEGVNFPVPAGTTPVYLNFYAALRYDSVNFWSLDVAHLEARNINSSAKEEKLRISGTADQEGASFRELLYSDEIGTLAGSADFSWNRDFSYIKCFVNLTDGRKDGEFYNIEGTLKERLYSVQADVSQMRFDRFVKWSDKAIVNGKVDISWDSIDSFQARIKLASFYALIKNNVLLGSASANINNDELTISDLSFDYAGLKTSMSEFQINRVLSFAKADADVQGYANKKNLETQINLNVDFNYIDSWLEYKKALNSIEGSIKTGKIIYSGGEQEPFSFVFAHDNGELTVSGGPKNMLRLDMDKDGFFFASISAPFPIHGSFAGKFENGLLDARCNDFFMDLSALYNLTASSDMFKIDGGYITGKIDVRGPVLNPEFFGTAKGASLRFKAPDYITQDIKPVPFNAVLEGNELTFTSVPSVVGSGTGEITGLLQFENWLPATVRLDIFVPRETPIPYGISIGGFNASGDASGKLFIIINDAIETFKSFEISGDLYANNTEMGLIFEDIAYHGVKLPEMELIPDDKSAVTANITITTGSSVEFLWPKSNPILRANPEMGTVIKITADNQTGIYTINSDVKIRNGEMSYMDRSFYIRQGNLVFRESEREFNPRITARAELRERTDSGPVTINMIIENQPLLKFAPRFEAVPGLTQLEIYTLLGGYSASMTGEDNTDTAQRFLVTSTTDILTQFLTNSDTFNQIISVRQMERQIRNLLKLDMFSVRTRILQNAITNSTMLGLAPVDRNSRVGNYFDNTTVFMGKYVGQDMFIQGMLSMRYDENNQSLGGLRFEPDIGIELQSPLFSIRWDFFPYHPENWWVNDNSFTLLWSRSF